LKDPFFHHHEIVIFQFLIQQLSTILRTTMPNFMDIGHDNRDIAVFHVFFSTEV